LSRLFVYYGECAIEHTTRTDAGAQLRDGVASVAKAGVCPESVWPYDNSQFRKKPPVAAYKAALPYRISEYVRLTTVDDMLHRLAPGFPFVFGFAVYESFESPEVAKTGVVNLPPSGETSLGGHAVMAVGYDLQAKRFIVRNSSGAGWGDGGYFTLPFEYLTGSLSHDFWTIRK
jgi:C1A family cysteine protease